MSPDDKRAEPEGEGVGEGVSEPAEPVDDLESLAGALPQPSEAPPDAEEADLDALSKVAGSRIAAAGPPAVVATPPAQQSTRTARSSWTAPLLLGVGLGAGFAVGLFALGVGRAPTQAAAKVAGSHAAAAEAPASDGPVPSAAAVAQADPAPPAPRAAQNVPAPPASAVERTSVGMPSQVRGAKSAAPPGAPHTEGSSRPDAPSEPSTAAAAVAAPSATPADVPGTSDDGLEKDAPGTAALAKAAAPETVDHLLDEALSPSARRQELERKREAALAAAELPLTPTRDQLTQAMVVLLPAIRGCAMGQHGMATAAIVVRSDGRVAGVEITGAPFVGASSGHCMEGVIRRARFPRFKQATFRIKFPLAIQ